MKKIILFTLITSVSLFAQRTEIETEILKNEFEGGGYFGYGFNTADKPVAETEITVPYVQYHLETIQQEKNKFYLTGAAGYRMHKKTVDGKAEDNEDQFGSEFYLDLDPQIRIYVPQNKINEFFNKEGNDEENDEWTGSWTEEKEQNKKNKWFTSFGLPVKYSSITPQNETADPYNHTIVDFTFNLGYDDKAVDMKKLSPWAEFENGLFAYGLFEYRLNESNDNESYEKMPMTLGLASDYAYDMDDFIKNSMIKGFLSLRYQMEADAIRFFPYEFVKGPYKGQYMELSYGFKYAKDINTQFNLLTSLHYTTNQLLDEHGDSINALYFDSRLNYYPIPELNTFGGFKMDLHLKKKDKEPEFKFYFGAVYTFDILKLNEKDEEEGYGF
ncbi:MAG: hypothetical protein R6V47_01555 [Candidatus Delongbacteria bacterium]